MITTISTSISFSIPKENEALTAFENNAELANWEITMTTSNVTYTSTKTYESTVQDSILNI